jgi:acyl transferase domain-containing protein
MHGSDLQTVIPHERWSVESVYAPEVTVGKMYVRFASFIPGVDEFDCAAFR